jgi:predicted membrane chloride channel (bestrophin family)
MLKHQTLLPAAAMRAVLCRAVPTQTYVGTVATMVCCYEDFLAKQLLPDWGFDWPGLAVSTSGVYSLSTFALSLLLVFRTNSSYQRWNDARKLWGLTTNRCRCVSRSLTFCCSRDRILQTGAQACC